MQSSIKAIKDSAFNIIGHNWQLVTVILNDGLEEIGKHAFFWRESLQEIVIASVVKAIKSGAFGVCAGLTTVTLGDGLEEIGVVAFVLCTSLRRIAIPPAAKAIDDSIQGLLKSNECEILRRIRRVCVLRGDPGLVESGRP